MGDGFWWGFCLAAFLWSALHMWLMHTYQAMLATSAVNPDRTPHELMGDFFYVVPEKEYNEMDRMRAWYQNGTPAARTAREKGEGK